MGSINMEAMRARLDSEQSGYSNTDYDRLSNGKNVRRVLWPKGNKESFFSEGFLHFSLGSDGKKVVTCPKSFDTATEKHKCPICEYVEKLQKSKSKEDKKLADNIKAKRRIYINVINRDADDEDDTPKVLPIGVTILRSLLETICDADYGDITDPETGRDITITRTGQGMKTEYSVLPKPKSSVVSETSEASEIEEKMTDLDSLFVEKSYEELESILNGDEDTEENDENEDDDDEDTEDEVDYDEMDIDELESLCKQRKIKMPKKVTRLSLISRLTEWDEKNSESDDDDDEDTEENGEDNDEVADAIAAALAKRKGKK